jgi:hypothetical protein
MRPRIQVLLREDAGGFKESPCWLPVCPVLCSCLGISSAALLHGDSIISPFGRSSACKSNCGWPGWPGWPETTIGDRWLRCSRPRLSEELAGRAVSGDAGPVTRQQQKPCILHAERVGVCVECRSTPQRRKGVAWLAADGDQDHHHYPPGHAIYPRRRPSHDGINTRFPGPGRPYLYKHCFLPALPSSSHLSFGPSRLGLYKHSTASARFAPLPHHTPWTSNYSGPLSNPSYNPAFDYTIEPSIQNAIFHKYPSRPPRLTPRNSP